MNKVKNVAIKALSCVCAACMLSGIVISNFKPTAADAAVANGATASFIKRNDIKTDREKYFDENVVYRLPEALSANQDISVIVTMDAQTTLQAYDNLKTNKTFSEYAATGAAQQVIAKADVSRNALIKKLNHSGVNYTLGAEYNTLVSGFEIEIKAGDFQKVENLLKDDAELMISEVYESAKTTEVVTNEVDVYETGIFDSSASKYQGAGVVVAVLDTGLDYTHSAFSESNFHPEDGKLALTLADVSSHIKDTVAATYTEGLTGEDVYLNTKVPYAYDYADRDPDVAPINSEHGTHVAGIIAGQDDRITGVAPQAQLAIMKVFSDAVDQSKQSWILCALEDCVTLGVDVINMSLGTSCGFSREQDEAKMTEVYNSIQARGISLICAASNDYNSTFGSDKNGSNPLTSNPDSGTVGSPSTYDSALSVASVDGVKTPYFLYDNEIMYFTEAVTSSAGDKKFVDDILKTQAQNLGVASLDEYEFPYVTISGYGEPGDYYGYPENYFKGKIALVRRGNTMFEQKVSVALKDMGATGIIIYNNVSGTINMSVGNDVGAVCSISQDDGEKLAKKSEGVIKISRSQVAGPFMSDFSSWGPTSDLKIKPEITGHGGEIESAVPGQGYDRFSGTSMACPNLAGATALIRQYVKEHKSVFTCNTDIDVTNRVNQLMMSTADIVKGKNGLPYAVRKQGAGLVNITKATTSAAYLTTYDKTGAAMEKTKFELGDDKQKNGVYEMTFDINNITGNALTYDVNGIVMSEGVSETYTGHSEKTSSQEAYMLGATTKVLSVTGGGAQNGNTVTVQANGVAKVTVKITLTDADKKYLSDNFENGMYVEGYITLTAKSGESAVNLNAPFLAFFGDWTQAPIFDEEYYDTNKDEINAGLNPEDKLMADAFATRVLGGIYSDYINTLGTYYFVQDPSATQIAASRDRIALSNYEDGENGAVNSLHSVYAGLLRNVREMQLTITEDATGKVVYDQVTYNQRKSYTRGGTINPEIIEVDLDVMAHNLKNNTKYTVTATAYIDYGENGEQNNKRSTFSFPLYIDFQAPVITDVEYRTEYDRTTKKTSLYADISVYDNHYAMAIGFGQIMLSEDPQFTYAMQSIGKYVTPVYSNFNSTSKVTLNLTDYVETLKKSASVSYDEEGNETQILGSNSFVASCYDYAMNAATYEIRLPDEILDIYFQTDKIDTDAYRRQGVIVDGETVKLSPYVTLNLEEVVDVYPLSSWMQTLNYESNNPDVVNVVNHTLVAKTPGTAIITAIGKKADGTQVKKQLNVTVLAEGEEGYKKFSKPKINKFEITEYHTNRAFYALTTEERSIGEAGTTYSFGKDKALSMYPSESITLKYTLDSYFPEDVTVKYTSSRNNIASVDETGTVVAKAKGNARVSVEVYLEGVRADRQTIEIEVKDPFNISTVNFLSYRGNGGVVEIPADRGITTISQFAFSNYEYVPKDLSAGDVIDEEDPYEIKPWFIGDDTITKVIIPEGVETIEQYAFANLTALEEVVLPSTLKKLGVGVFAQCSKLKKINLEHVQFINANAFAGCSALEGVNLATVNAIGDNAFNGCSLTSLKLPVTSQSIGISAFADNKFLASITFEAPKMKIGRYAFNGCTKLSKININAAVVAAYAFNGCSILSDVTLGKDVAVIGEYAFAGTNVSAFKLDNTNQNLSTAESGAYVLSKDGKKLVVAAPKGLPTGVTLPTAVETIGAGAFSGNKTIFTINGANVTDIEAYAFMGCSNLDAAVFPVLETVGDYAFYGAGLNETPVLDSVAVIGDYAFASTELQEVTLGDGVVIGDYAFAYCNYLNTVTLGNDVTIGDYAFASNIVMYDIDTLTPMLEQVQAEGGDVYALLSQVLTQYYTHYLYAVYDTEGNPAVGKNGAEIKLDFYRYNLTSNVNSQLKTVVIGNNAIIGDNAFADNANMDALTLGSNAEIGDAAFYNSLSLTTVDLTAVKSLGDNAFSGTRTPDWWKISEGEFNYAYEIFSIGTGANGEPELAAKNQIYSYFAPKFTTVELTAAESVGAGAFAYNNELLSATIGDSVTKIADNVFYGASKLATVTYGNDVTSIGVNAFCDTAITAAQLQNVEVIGANAFAYTPLTAVTLKDGAQIGDAAFAACESLATVTGLDKATYIGAMAFYGTALTEANVSAAQYIGDMAFASSAVTKVTLGEKLLALGNNPFRNCAIATFGKLVEDENGREELVETYDVSATVKVVDGVLYQAVPNGLELVAYPTLKADRAYTVLDGTVRIAAGAFLGSPVEYVTLASELASIGEKAFYGCNNLTTVVFRSYNAPILEEEYDSTYTIGENLPVTGYMAGYVGLGIVKYTMWSASDNVFYYGANFVNYVGKVTDKLVMVKPENGQNYATFMLSQYFDVTIDGPTAMMDVTRKAIAAINALPTTVTLNDKAAVEAARKAYNALILKQQALVTNVSKLTLAEAQIRALEEEGKAQPEVPAPVAPETLSTTDIVAIVVGSVVAAAIIGFAVWTYIKGIRNQKKSNDEA